MRKPGGTPSRRDKYVTPAAISAPGAARGHFVGGQQSSLAGCKPPPLFMRGASSCSSQGRRQGEPWSASPGPSAPTYLPTYLPNFAPLAVSPPLARPCLQGTVVKRYPGPDTSSGESLTSMYIYIIYINIVLYACMPFFACVAICMHD